ncbi:DUF3084 domain-containing protein [Phormidesmis priestleyi ULC007]|uniref:DUF3084 domain-containing protein n=1 Tax=Phormidesmis priestleyi ULC007 TaxID=1920490 RepID=A0A2T1DDL3_9CYAN|nr:DUF3084 domain-containing protein [Phormidesmis priestleyi]PSB18543.1 DUF3084 domain-containing protein [Phormidesmis priestleyi ULC007]PZO49808.1 MAG: DUF3084 domain-containing protein [Phormidesmis priestleyi]
MSGYILIFAVLILGGVIATVGDRIGTRVGKARLSLFNMRPRRTAVLVTILTGTLISASTLGILLATSEQLRIGILQLGQLQKKISGFRATLSKTTQELENTTQQKGQVEAELSKTKSEQSRVEAQLNRTNQYLKQATDRQARTDAQLQLAEAQRDRVRLQLSTVSQQATSLRSEINQLQSERQVLVAERNQVQAQIAQRDAEITKRTQLIKQRDLDIADRDTVIAQREQRLKALEDQRAFLAQEVQRSDEEARLVRLGILGVERNQVLASAVVRIVNPQVASQAVDQLLREANRVALQRVQPIGAKPTDQIVQITKPEVQQLTEQIDDGQDYVVRILSAANYVKGEKTPIAIFADAVRNQVLFLAGDVIAAKSIEPAKLSNAELSQSISQLIDASRFRARRAGVLSDSVQIEGVQSLQSWTSFAENLRQFQTPVEVRVVASEVTSTVGPLKIELVAVQNGQVVLRTS